MASHVRVVVRVRPLSYDEITTGAVEVLAQGEDDPNTKLLVRDATIAERTAKRNPKMVSPLRGSVPLLEDEQRKRFSFGRVLWTDASQDETFEAAGAPAFRAFMDGYSASVLAYGPTGCGKTFAIFGGHSSTSEAVQAPSSPRTRAELRSRLAGIVPRVARGLFDSLDETTGRAIPSWAPAGTVLERWEVRVSFLEVYNERVHDLLTHIDTVSEDGSVPVRGVRKVVRASRPAEVVLAEREAGLLVAEEESADEDEMKEGEERKDDVVRGGVRAWRVRKTGPPRVPPELAKDGDLVADSLRLLEAPRSSSPAIAVGLGEYRCGRAEEVEGLILAGMEARTVASTARNDRSSRGHALFTIRLTRQLRLPSGERRDLTSRLVLGDLAGSESANRTVHQSTTSKPSTPSRTSMSTPSTPTSSSTPRRRRWDASRPGAPSTRVKDASRSRAAELRAINTSLVALGAVVRSLASGSKHVPYRTSVLTRLLRGSIGGRSTTVLLATVSPASSSQSETLSTLQYAAAAATIRTHARLHDVVHAPENPVKEIRRLKARVQELEEILRKRPVRPPPPPNKPNKKLHQLQAALETHLLTLERVLNLSDPPKGLEDRMAGACGALEGYVGDMATRLASARGAVHRAREETSEERRKMEEVLDKMAVREKEAETLRTALATARASIRAAKKEADAAAAKVAETEAEMAKVERKRESALFQAREEVQRAQSEAETRVAVAFRRATVAEENVKMAREDAESAKTEFRMRAFAAAEKMMEKARETWAAQRAMAERENARALAVMREEMENKFENERLELRKLGGLEERKLVEEEAKKVQDALQADIDTLQATVEHLQGQIREAEEARRRMEEQTKLDDAERTKSFEEREAKVRKELEQEKREAVQLAVDEAVSVAREEWEGEARDLVRQGREEAAQEMATKKETEFAKILETKHQEWQSLAETQKAEAVQHTIQEAESQKQAALDEQRKSLNEEALQNLNDALQNQEKAITESMQLERSKALQDQKTDLEAEASRDKASALEEQREQLKNQAEQRLQESLQAQKQQLEDAASKSLAEQKRDLETAFEAEKQTLAKSHQSALDAALEAAEKRRQDDLQHRDEEHASHLESERSKWQKHTELQLEKLQDAADKQLAERTKEKDGEIAALEERMQLQQIEAEKTKTEAVNSAVREVRREEAIKRHEALQQAQLEDKPSFWGEAVKKARQEARKEAEETLVPFAIEEAVEHEKSLRLEAEAQVEQLQQKITTLQAQIDAANDATSRAVAAAASATDRAVELARSATTKQTSSNTQRLQKVLERLEPVVADAKDLASSTRVRSPTLRRRTKSPSRPPAGPRASSIDTEEAAKKRLPVSPFSERSFASSSKSPSYRDTPQK